MMTPNKMFKPIQIEASVWMQMFALCKAADTEVQWYSNIEETPDSLYVSQLWVPEQEGTATTVRSSAFEMMDIEEEAGYPLKFWGHSHVDMGVTPSPQDDKYVRERLECGFDYVIMFIMNRRQEHHCEFHTKYNAVSLKVEIVHSLHDAWAKEEVAKKLRKKLYTTPTSYMRPSTHGTSYTPPNGGKSITSGVNSTYSKRFPSS